MAKYALIIEDDPETGKVITQAGALTPESLNPWEKSTEDQLTGAGKTFKNLMDTLNMMGALGDGQ